MLLIPKKIQKFSKRRFQPFYEVFDFSSESVYVISKPLQTIKKYKYVFYVETRNTTFDRKFDLRISFSRLKLHRTLKCHYKNLSETKVTKNRPHRTHPTESKLSTWRIDKSRRVPRGNQINCRVHRAIVKMLSILAKFITLSAWSMAEVNSQYSLYQKRQSS